MLNIKTRINEYRSVLQMLWLIYILFAEKFKAKISANIFCFKKFALFMVCLS